MLRGSLIVISNVLFLILFLRLWVRDWQDLAFNPYFAPLARATEKGVRFLKPALFFLPDHLIVLACLVFLLALRGLLFYNTLHPWRIAAGATLMMRDIDPGSLASCLLFSLLSLLQFAIRIWSLAWFVSLLDGGRNRSAAAEALQTLSWPSSVLRGWHRPAAILAANVLLVSLLDHAGRPVEINPVFSALTLNWTAEPLRALLRAGLLSVGATLDGLMLAHSLMVLCVITSLISALMGNPRLNLQSREWIQLLLGRFAGNPIIAGNWDLTPLVFLLLLPLAYAILLNPVAFLLTLL